MNYGRRRLLATIPQSRGLERLWKRGWVAFLASCPLFIERVLQYRQVFGHFPNVYNPKTLNEKVIYRSLFDRREIIWICGDKLLARQYAMSKVGNAIRFSKLHAIYEKPCDVAPEDLPHEFVMKANYDTGFLKIFRRDDPRTAAGMQAMAEEWFRRSYRNEKKWWGSHPIKPKVLVEELLLDNGHIPYDYKFLCFDGKPAFVTVHVDFFGDHRENFYDMDWNLVCANVGSVLNTDQPLPKPPNFDLMRRAAAALSRGIEFIRVDLYDVNGEVYFGELTMDPAGGLDTDRPAHIDQELGRQWTLPTRRELRQNRGKSPGRRSESTIVLIAKLVLFSGG